MRSINILHLSDLHISKTRNLSATSKKLIKDIAEQTQNMKELILLISGDIVDQGNYKYQKGVLDFFEKLNESTDKKIKKVFIVPGNHDKERTASNSIFGEYFQISNAKIDKEIWELQRQNYSSYLNMEYQIKKIFTSRVKQIKDTFCVDLCKINNKNICFIQIDTTWATYGGKKENGNLILGQYQLKTLMKEYENVKEKLEKNGDEIDLTIGIGYHPLSWLNPQEEKLVKKYMIDEEYFNMSLYMCGHIHDMNLENLYNEEHSLMTLVTGIGWNHQNRESGERDKKDEHRYSIYILDIEKNSCNIIMRKSGKSGTFERETNIYKSNSDDGNLCFPLKIASNRQPFINMNVPIEDLGKSIFVDARIMNKIESVNYLMIMLQKGWDQTIVYYKNEYIERNLDKIDHEMQKKLYDYFYKNIKDNDVETFFEKDVDNIYELFTAYLQELLNQFIANFEDILPPETNLRVHFRCYEKKNDKYYKLCQSSSIDGETGPNISTIQWGGLIEKSYELQKPLIYSINCRHNSLYPVRWDDFMTVVPLFFKNIQEFRNKKHKKVKRPIITFGISMQNDNYKSELSEILYILEYLKIDQVVTETLDDFVEQFSIDFTNYVYYFDKKLEGGNANE